VARSRSYRRRWLLVPTLAVSSIAQGGAIITYQVTRPPPKPTLTIRLVGEIAEEGGQVLVTRVGDGAPILRCMQERCSIDLPPGTQVQLSALPSDDGVFAGYGQYPMRTPPELVHLLGDPLAKCMGGDALDAAAAGDVLNCNLTVTANLDVAVAFDLKPEEMQMLEPPKDPDALPIAMADPKTPPPPPTPIEAEKLDAPTVALVPPEKMAQIKPPPPIPPPPPPPPPQDQPKQPPPPPPPNQVMVEVKDDKHEVEKAPDDAEKLSDKNRDVDEETRAKETNLDQESEGQQVASRENDDKSSKEIGGPDDKIRQNEETEPTTDERVKESDHSGDDEVAKGIVKGEEGDKGEDGKGEKDPGLLAMRGIAGRGSIYDQRDGKKLGKKGLPGVNTPLQTTDYERLMGRDKVEEERQIASRKLGSKKGRWEKKLDAIKSSLENFVPDVRPGNQTALKTRAHPYAVYIARMHRRIHELWGFGFLEQLDNRAANDPLNDTNLWVNLEVSVNQDGTLHKVTIAKTSGKTEFDVAAVDTVITAGPFESTPEAIRSVDGRIYLRWGFYRNWRQCGTFNVEPYILTSVPEGNDVGVLDGGGSVPTKQPRITPKRNPIGEGTVTPADPKEKEQASPSTSVTDRQAVFAANMWIAGFATANIDKLVKNSVTPFYASGSVAANTAGELKDMYGELVAESGAMKDWKLLKASEYPGGAKFPEGTVVVTVQAANATFAVVMSKTPSGDYRATQIAR